MTNDKTYKQERDESAEEWASKTLRHDLKEKKPITYKEQIETFCDGADWAITSSIVKELVEALDNMTYYSSCGACEENAEFRTEAIAKYQKAIKDLK